MRALFLLSALLFATGCSSSRLVAPGTGSGGSTNLDLIGEPVTVHLADGQLERGRFLGLYPDSTAWLDASGTRVQVSTREVVGVTRVSRWGGAWRGAAIGAIATAVTAGALAYYDLRQYRRDSGEPCPGFCGLLDDSIYIGAATVGFVAGGAVGGTAGAAVGSRERYVLEAPLAPNSALVYRRSLSGRGYSATTSNGFE